MMSPRVAAIIERIHAAEDELRQDIIEQGQRWRLGVEQHVARFSPETRRFHRTFKPRLLTFLSAARPLPLLTAPVIYSLVLPLSLLDAWMTLYQWICFPVYGIPRVKRGDYFAIDHQHLAYLNAVEKFHCVYCSYANGLISHVREIAARTEQYWCPIKHAQPIAAPHGRYATFVDYGDAAGYRRELEAFRRSLSDEQRHPEKMASRLS